MQNVIKNPENSSSSISFQQIILIVFKIPGWLGLIYLISKRWYGYCFETNIWKTKPNIILCWDYRKFSNNKFRENLISRLSAENIRVRYNGMEKFYKQICIKALDELADQNKKYSRENNMSFINKTIKKPSWEIFVSKTVKITTNVNTTNRETIAYLFYVKERLIIMRTWMIKIWLIISNFDEP